MENKIGTLTFHWATNYGAIIQAYALQHFLLINNYDSVIINYLPEKRNLTFYIKKIVKFEFFELLKEIKLKQFRNKNLRLTNKIYNCYEEKKYLNFDCIICGSDQIWNRFLTLQNNNLTYFLSFASSDTKKIAYAASFGTNEIPDEMSKIIKTPLTNFSSISVRESSGVYILSKIGIKSIMAIDPTLLLDASDYLKFIKAMKLKKQFIFAYILHNDKDLFSQLSKISKSLFKEKTLIDFNSARSMENWLTLIYNSKFVITNSFHGMIFSVIFHKEFYVLPTKNSEMNDRIVSFLEIVNLKERFINDICEIKNFTCKKIDWNIVESKLAYFKFYSKKFLLDSIKK